MIRQEGQVFERIKSPSIGTVVNNHVSKNEYYPVYIVEGFYLDPVYQRLSNAWKWRKINEDGTLGEKESDYGLFSKVDREYEVEIKIKWSE